MATKKKVAALTPEQKKSVSARKAGLALKKQKPKDYYSKMAKSSHPRAEYHGGRPKGSKNKPK